MKRTNVNCWIFLSIVALAALFSGSANAAIAINDTYSFSTVDTTPLDVHVVDNDDVETNFNNVLLSVGEIFTANAVINVIIPSEGNPYFAVSPDSGFTTGTIEFNYKVEDTAGASEAFVSIAVTAGSTDKLLDDTYFVTAGNTVTFDVLSNDTISASEFDVAADDSALPAGSLINEPGVGVYTFNATGVSAGEYTFTYTVDAVDGQTATVKVLVDTATTPKSVITASLLSGSALAENDSGLITLTRTGSSQEAISIQVSSATASTADASDFSLSLTTVSWSAGDTASKTVTVSINEDTSVEPQESLVIEFTNATGGAVYEGSDISFTIAATDEVEFAQSTYTVSEDAGSIVVEMIRSGTGSGAASVAIHLNTGTSTATEGDDFTFTDLTTVSWASGEVGSKTVTIPITLDTDALETTESIALELTSENNLVLGAKDATGVSITNVVSVDDVSFVASAYSVAEVGTSVTVQVQRVGNGVGVASVIVELGAVETASEGVDFTFTSAVTVNWADGETGTKDISIPIATDLLVEGDETFSLSLGITPTNLNLGSPVASQVTITDVVPVDDVSFVNGSYSVAEGAGSVTVQVQRVGSGVSVASVVVELGTVETASEGVDFTFTSAVTVNWADGETGTKDISIPIATDLLVEGDETFSLSLGSTPTNLNLGSPVASQVTITDVVPIDDVSFVNGSYSVAEGAGSVTVQVQRVGSGVSAASAVVELGTVETASEGVDFTFTSAVTVNWADGETGTKDISIPIAADLLVEGDETFSLSLGITPTNLNLGSPVASQVTITDVVPVDDVSFVNGSYSVAEGAGSVTVQVQRVGSGVSAASAVVELGTVETASEGVDFTFASAVTVNWTNGETGTKDITIPIATDLLVEGGETFSLSLGTSPTNLNLGSTITSQVTITDVVPVDDVSFVNGSYSIAESAGSVIVQVQRVGSGVNAASVVVELGTVETASEGGDFTFASAVTVNWTNGETGTKDITIPIAADLLVEGDETFSLSLGTTPTNLNLGSSVTSQVTITDVVPVDDVSFVNGSYSVAEGAGSVTVQVQRVGSGVSAASAVVELGTVETASEGVDFTFASAVTVNWTNGETGTKDITIPIAADLLVEGDETFSLSLGTTPTYLNLGSSVTSQVTITDVVPVDDVSFVNGSYSVAEGAGSVTVQVQRVGSGVSAASAVVELGTVETASEGGDFTFASAVTVNWTNGETGTKDITIPIATDLLVEGDETFSLSLGTTPTNLNLGSSVISQITITDVVPVDDVSFVNTTYTVTEGDGVVTVQVQRVGSGVGVASLIVELSTEETASEDTDFIFAAPVTVSWVDGETGLKDINIPIVADASVEEAETFTLSINAQVSGSNLGENISTQVTIVDNGITELDSIGFTNTTYRAAEETGFIDISFLRTGTGTGPAEVNVSFVLVADEPSVGVSPANESDFTLPSDTVVKWLDGEVGVKTLTVNISPDSSTDADGDLDGEFFTLVLDPESLVGDVQLKDAADEAGVVIFAKELLGNIVADDSPVKDVADAIDSVCANVDSSDTGALAECEKLSELDEAEIEQALAVIQPKTVEAQIESAVALAGNQLQNLRKRLSELRSGRNQVSLAGLNMSLFDESVPLPAAMQSMLDASVGGAAGEGGLLDSPWGAFVNGTLSVGEQDDVDDSLGYDISSKGITAGVDYRINRKMIVGVAVGFGSADSDFNQDSGSQDSSSLTLTVFGNHFINNKIYADWIVSYTKNDFDIKRNMVVLGTTHNISASPDGHQYSVAVGGGYDYVRGPLQITGFGRIDYINTIIDSYDETGSFYALTLSEQREESLSTAFGVKSAYVFNTKKAVYIPSLEVEWVHQYNEDARTIDAAFAQSPSSGSFSIETQKSDRDYMNAAFSVSAMFSGGKSAFFRYDTLLGEDDRTSESYTLGGRYEF